MALERIELFNKKEFFSFLLFCLLILSYSLLINFQEYKKLTRFDSVLIDARVLKQYAKTKGTKEYQVLKLKSDNGTTFYTSANKKFKEAKGKKLHLEIWTKELSFYKYLTGFYAFSKIISIDEEETLKQKLNSFLASKHKDENIANMYQALYSASALSKELQTTFSTLGVSHLLAISGFHLGVLSALLFFLFRPIYTFFQNIYFPYTNSKTHLFILVASFLFFYLLFLDYPPSLLRSFVMLLVGFTLFDRGIKIISMQTLALTIILILSFAPKLFFALGFWLSVSGVFYIFLFLIHFKHLSKIWQFILVPFWVYLLMLPFSLSIFGNFSIYHPLSILWTSLFSIFYPLSIVLHLVSQGDIFDPLLLNLINLSNGNEPIHLSIIWIIFHIGLSLTSIYKRPFMFILLCESIIFFLYFFYNIMQKAF
ncbi:ComEC/Rec2 family competence protein [Sulfurimonas sp.]|uniref:ComEC/Rec2 family competence protein n=1 Tax=Sulfurimonas sp. TaxID=2022749 RepID=UPI002B45DC3A|nr:ComEC/Rec2 family competence protein [Sulfurimonas sp.]